MGGGESREETTEKSEGELGKKNFPGVRLWCPRPAFGAYRMCAEVSYYRDACTSEQNLALASS